MSLFLFVDGTPKMFFILQDSSWLQHILADLLRQLYLRIILEPNEMICKTVLEV